MELADLESDEERAIYELVTRHFIACCYKDAKGSLTTLKVQVPMRGGEVGRLGLSRCTLRNGLCYHLAGLHCEWTDDHRPQLAVGVQVREVACQ